MESKRLTNLQTEAILNPEDLSSQEKAYLETLDRRKAEEKYKTDSAKAKTSKVIQQRFVDERIPSSNIDWMNSCLLYTSPSPRDRTRSRMPSSA